MDSKRVCFPHQLSGDAGSNQCNRVVSDDSSRHLSSGHVGQHYGRVIHQAGRGHTLLVPLHSDHAIIQIVPVAGGHPSGGVCSRPSQCDGRQTVKVQSGSGFGVDSIGSPVCPNPSAISNATGGSICHKVDKSTSPIRFSFSGRGSMGDGCSLDLMDRSHSLRISSDKPDPTCSDKSSVIGHVSLPSSSQVAKATMVSDVVRSPSGSPIGDSDLPSNAPPAGRHGLSLESNCSGPSRLAFIKQNLLEAGFSEEAASRAVKPQRKSSLQLYQSRWAHFARWCSQRDTDPYSASIQQIADFLLYLFNDRHCSLTTVAGYRTAISQTRPPIDGLPVGINPVLTNLLKNLRLEKPRRMVQVPDWDLNVILDALMEAPFEPPKWSSPEFRKFTTLKTVFLLTLAMGARRSELHALSRHSRDLVFSKKGVSLRTKPQFLAKNQRPDHDPGPFFVKALTPFTGREAKERLLCPVQILKFYLDFTSATVDSSGPLFTKILGSGLPSSQTISSWLKQLIKFVYECKGLSVQARGHEVRRMAASWAFFAGVSSNAIIEAGRWRSSSTFMSYYLADVQCQRDGYYRPLPCVAMGAPCHV